MDTSTYSKSGSRPYTPDHAYAEKLARQGANIQTTKATVIIAFKKAAEPLKLKMADRCLMDYLVSLSRDIDWQTEQEPIVWPSNYLLADFMGVSKQAIQSHLRRLCRLGLISFKDSPNGKRYGYRNDEGLIVEAYGIKLSPLAARISEFESLSTVHQENRQTVKLLKKDITRHRRSIFMVIETAREYALKGDWSSLKSEYQSLIELLHSRNDREELQAIANGFEALLVKVKGVYDEALEKAETSQNKEKTLPKGQVTLSHNILTNLNTNYVNCNGKTPSNGFQLMNEVDDEDLEQPHSLSERVFPEGVLSACPVFEDFCQKSDQRVTWPMIEQTAHVLRPSLGISPNAWQEAITILGRKQAATALAIIVQKHSEGEVKNAGGYLRGMIAKAKLNELHLTKSLFRTSQHQIN